MQHHEQHKYCNLECQKRDIAITWQLITSWYVTSIFTPSSELLIIDLVRVCVCRWRWGCRWCSSWLWRNHLEDHSQESNRPWLRNHMCALVEMFEIELWVLCQQLLTAVLNSKELSVFHYKICRYPTALFDSPLSCLSLTHPNWLHTHKCSCERWKRMPNMG